MKAFSRIPDPFGEHLQTLKFEIPMKTVFRVDAISQGMIHHKVHHIINNPNQNRQAFLSLDIDDDAKQKIIKESQNTAITQENQASKELEIKQKLNEAKKCVQEKEQKMGGILSCEEINISQKSQKIIETSKTKTLKTILYPNKQTQQKSQQQQKDSLPIQSNFKYQLSHIIFSPIPQEMISNIVHKRPIFAKETPLSTTQMKTVKQLALQKQIKQGQNEPNRKEIQKIQELAIENDSQVSENIECSFFGNTIEKEDPEELKKTGFNLVDSVVKMFQNQFSRPKSLSEVNEIQQKQKQNTLDIEFQNRKDNIKKLGGRKLIQSRLSKKKSLEPAKLQFIKTISINPVFF